MRPVVSLRERGGGGGGEEDEGRRFVVLRALGGAAPWAFGAEASPQRPATFQLFPAGKSGPDGRTTW